MRVWIGVREVVVKKVANEVAPDVGRETCAERARVCAYYEEDFEEYKSVSRHGDMHGREWKSSKMKMPSPSNEPLNASIAITCIKTTICIYS